MAYSTVAERQQAEAVTFQFPNASLKSGEDSPESKNPSQGFHLLACKTRYFTQLPVISSFQFLMPRFEVASNLDCLTLRPIALLLCSWLWNRVEPRRDEIRERIQEANGA